MTRSTPRARRSEYNERELLEPTLAKIKGLTVGLPEEYFIDGIEPEVKNEIDTAIEKLRAWA